MLLDELDLEDEEDKQDDGEAAARLEARKRLRREAEVSRLVVCPVLLICNDSWVSVRHHNLICTSRCCCLLFKPDLQPMLLL